MAYTQQAYRLIEVVWIPNLYTFTSQLARMIIFSPNTIWSQAQYNMIHILEHSIGMIICCGVEPKVYTLLSVPLSSTKDIILENIRLSRPIA